MTDAITSIAETVQQIAIATAEQARGSEQILRAAERMKTITKHVERSSQEQNRGSKQITASIESISEMVNRLMNAHREQSRAAEQILAAVEPVRHSARRPAASTSDLPAARTRGLGLVTANTGFFPVAAFARPTSPAK